MLEAKIANLIAHTGMPAARVRDLVTGKIRLSYPMVPRYGHTHCPIRFALEVACQVWHEGEPTEACDCAECRHA